MTTTTDTDLPDLTDMSLADLLTASPVLAAAVQRVGDEDDEAQGIVAGFQSAI